MTNKKSSQHFKYKNNNSSTNNYIIKKDTRTEEDPYKIFNLLQLGINIPVLDEFKQYILHDLIYFKAKSLLMLENGNIVGHALVYYTDPKTLYFGYFKVALDKEDRIIFLLEKLIEYAKKNDFLIIKGPINIPTIIFGWGFMEKDSESSLFVHKPVTNPLYIEIFQKNGFIIDLKEFSHEGNIKAIPEEIFKNFDFSNYEILNPKSWDEIISLKTEFLELNAKNLSQDSVITPDTIGVFDNYFAFVQKYGKPYYFVFVKYKPTDKIVGCFVSTPNPFRTNEKGKYDSFFVFTIVLDKEHRKKSIGWLLTKEAFNQALKHNINYLSSSIGSNVASTIKMGTRLGFNLTRTHFIVSLSINQ